MAEIFYTVSPHLHRAARLEEGLVVELDFEIPGKLPSLLGGIFLGRVVEIQKPLSAGFVDIGEEKLGLLPLREGKLPPVKQGDSVVVQVSRTANPFEGKGVRLTRLITLSLGPLLYTPLTPGLSYSQKIKNREAFKKLFTLEEKEGLIIRHWASLHDPFEKYLSDLRSEWRKIQEKLLTKPPLRLSSSYSLLTRILRSLGSPDTLTVDDLELVQKGGQYSRQCAFDERCEEAWNSLLSPEIPLAQGGNLYIEETRGLTVIDVNSHGALRHPFSFNHGAVREALKQIRLRELGGKIVVDLIAASSDIKALLRGVELASDLEIWGISPMGLLEMTRRRKRLSLPQRLKLGLN